MKFASFISEDLSKWWRKKMLTWPVYLCFQEESQRILAINSELLSTQTRSCKDEPFLNTSPLQKKLEALGQCMKQVV